MTRVSTMVLVVVGTLTACKKKQEVTKPACPATAWKEPSGLFCVDVAGFAPGEIKKSADDEPEYSIYFKKPTDDPMKPPVGFTISWYTTRDPGEALVQNMVTDDHGNFAGGKGKYVLRTNKNDAKSHELAAIVHGNKHAYRCRARSYDAPIALEAIAACKSLLATD